MLEAEFWVWLPWGFLLSTPVSKSWHLYIQAVKSQVGPSKQTPRLLIQKADKRQGPQACRPCPHVLVTPRSDRVSWTWARKWIRGWDSHEHWPLAFNTGLVHQWDWSDKYPQLWPIISVTPMRRNKESGEVKEVRSVGEFLSSLGYSPQCGKSERNSLPLQQCSLLCVFFLLLLKIIRSTKI